MKVPTTMNAVRCHPSKPVSGAERAAMLAPKNVLSMSLWAGVMA
jgi:hypothetical protein